MKKLFAEEKNAYIIKAVSRISFYLLLFSSLVYSQQNDFPIYQTADYTTSKGLTNIFVANIDNKGSYDLIFYNNSDLGYTYHSSERLRKPRRKYFFYPISSIKLFKPAEKGINRKYIFTSEESGIVGLVSFTEYGGMRLLNIKDAKDYPSKVDVGNFLAVPENRAIVLGNNFIGLSIFSEKNFKLKENKLIKYGSFSEGGLVDIDIDGMNDLVLFDNASQKLLYYLNVTNSFQLTKEEELSGEISKFKVNDFDGDRVRDFSFLIGDSLAIYIVNSNPQNIKHFSIYIKGCADYKFLKINNDKKTDILAIDSTGRMLAFYNNGDNSFLPAETITSAPGAKALATVWDIDRRKLALLSNEGRFFTFEKTSRIDTTKNILLYGNDFTAPEINNGIHTIRTYWIDKNNFKLRKLSISKRTGKITEGSSPLSFIPDNFEIIKNKSETLFLFTKYLSDGFTYLIKNEGKNELVFTNTNRIRVKGDLLIEQSADSLNFFFPIIKGNKIIFDTLLFSPKPLTLLSANNGKFTYLSEKNDLVFAHLENSGITTDTVYQVKRTSDLFELQFNNSSPTVISINGNKINLFTKDSLIKYYSSKHFNSQNVIPRFAKLSENSSLIIYDKKNNDFLKSDIRTSKSFLRFKPLFNFVGIKNFLPVKIDKKKFVIFFDEKLNSLTFKEIL